MTDDSEARRLEKLMEDNGFRVQDLRVYGHDRTVEKIVVMAVMPDKKE